MVVASVLLAIVVTSGYGDTYNNPDWICGDVNDDSFVNYTDLSSLNSYILRQGAQPDPVARANVDGGCRVNIADLVYLYNYLMYSGPGPTGCPDTVACEGVPDAGNEVWIGQPPYYEYPGSDSVAVPIYISNSLPLGGISLGFEYNTTDYQITSRNGSGTLIAGNLYHFDETKVLIYQLTTGSVITPQEGGTLLVLNAQMLTGDPEISIGLTPSFISPGGDFIFVAFEQGVGSSIVSPSFIGEAGCSEFTPTETAWSFDFTVNNLWPPEAYASINYANDPNLAKPLGYLPESSMYPSWDAYVGLKGEDECYLQHGKANRVARPSQAINWAALMSDPTATSGMTQYSGARMALEFCMECWDLSEMFPDHSTLSEVPIEDARSLINSAYLTQFLHEELENMNYELNYHFQFDGTLLETFNQYCEMLNSGSIDRLLISNAGHVLVPYAYEVLPPLYDYGYIYAYDPFYYGYWDRRVCFHWGTEGSPELYWWEYNSSVHFGNEQYKIWLSAPLDSYGSSGCQLNKSLLKSGNQERDHDTRSDDIVVYLAQVDIVTVESSAGFLGHIGDSIFSTMDDGCPIIPLSGDSTEPIGYFLPNASVAFCI